MVCYMYLRVVTLFDLSETVTVQGSPRTNHFCLGRSFSKKLRETVEKLYFNGRCHDNNNFLKLVGRRKDNE